MAVKELLKKGADKAKDVAVEEAKKGVKRKAEGAARKQISKSELGAKALKTYDKTKKAIKNSKRAIAFGKFIVSSPIGWATGGAIAVGVLAIGANVHSSINANNNAYLSSMVSSSQVQLLNNSGISQEEVAGLLSMGCDVDTAGDSSGTRMSADGEVVTESSNPFVQKIGGKVQNAEKIKTRLIQEGFSGGQIAVIMAIGARESGLDPKANNGVGHIGIFQWGDQSGDSSVGAVSVNSDRTKWMRDNNMDIWDIENQLSLLMHELSTSHKTTITKLVNYQSTSDSDIEALMEIWDQYYEGVMPDDWQRKTSDVRKWVKGVLEVFPDLNDVKQSANFLDKFNAAEGESEGNRSNSVSATTAEVCGVSAENIGGDALAQALVLAAFQYYGKGIVYSQGSERGTIDRDKSGNVTGGFLDCSAFVFQAMNDIGIADIPTIGNTETLFGLKGKVLQEISRDEVTTGDIFVVGTPGQSGGNGGHTGIFLNKNWVIHCSTNASENDGGSGDIFINDYPSNHFGLEPHFYRIIDRSVPEKASEVKASDTFVDLTTNEALEEAVKSGKIKNPNNVDAGQSSADLMGSIIAGEGNFVIGNVTTAYPVGQCTWGAKQVAPWAGEYWGNGGDWGRSAAAAGFKTGKTPKVGAIVSWNDGGYGHVAVVTGVKADGTIRVLESNVNGVQVIKDHRGWFNPIGIQGEVTYIYPR